MRKHDSESHILRERGKHLKDTETKLAFIKARAEGKSYRQIGKELGLAKTTCQSWEKTLKQEIQELKQAQLEELYTTYNMKREARIKALGNILQEIDNAISEKPLEELPADKLLELRLKYGRELREEYKEPVEETDNTLDGLLEQYNHLYREARTGNYSPADIKAQLGILDAKRETIYRIAGEQAREAEDPLGIEFTSYTSKIIRHEERAGA